MSTTPWIVRDADSGNERTFESRGNAEAAVDELADLGLDVELLPPSEVDAPEIHEENGGGSAVPEESDGEPTTPEGSDGESATSEESDGETAVVEAETYDLPERSISDDPLKWVPGEFVDEIDGTQAINRKGFEVLSHFYDIDVEAEVQVSPNETNFEYSQVKATATTPDGRRCEAHASAHVDRGDESVLLLELADTRARKRAISIATGVGAVAVEELKNEVAIEEPDS